MHYLSGVACAGADLCAAVGLGTRAIVGTRDGGATWTTQGPGAADLRGVSCPSTTTCVAVGATRSGLAAVYRTSDSGHSWQRQPIG